MFPQVPAHPSTECMRTDKLHSDPVEFFDVTYHKTQPQTNRHPYIGRHSRRGQTIHTSICLLSTCAISLPPQRSSGTIKSPSWWIMSSPQSGSTTSMPTLIYCSRWVGTSSKLGWRQNRGGWRRSILGYRMAGEFFGCSEVVVVEKKSKKKKGKNKYRKGGKGNEKEVKSPSYGIYAAAGMMISSVSLGSQWSWP